MNMVSATIAKATMRISLPNWQTDQRGRAELEKIVKRITKEGEGRDFDCIMGVSGGIASSYLTYWAKELGLRPLVFAVARPS
jgi:hypothetical protein